ncbi:hypothetical protein [Roseovarius sp.]|uniref:hypothetical protein n=1 Tax=Roseovarius sp. TaxID=1486281 RepID=UPI0025DAD287|nr:hypothetical protein [Roseovarius sp.]
MPENWMNRRLVLTSLCALVVAGPVAAQHEDGTATDHGADTGHASGAGGAQHGRPADAHNSGEDDHGDDHGDDHTSDEGDHSDHESGGKGKGPKYRGGRDTVTVGVGHGRSLEERVLKVPAF